jgi:hypothetical protein
LLFRNPLALRRHRRRCFSSPDVKVRPIAKLIWPEIAAPFLAAPRRLTRSNLQPLFAFARPASSPRADQPRANQHPQPQNSSSRAALKSPYAAVSPATSQNRHCKIAKSTCKPDLAKPLAPERDHRINSRRPDGSNCLKPSRSDLAISYADRCGFRYPAFDCCQRALASMGFAYVRSACLRSACLGSMGIRSMGPSYLGPSYLYPACAATL